jgi:hypothetical protein
MLLRRQLILSESDELLANETHDSRGAELSLNCINQSMAASLSGIREDALVGLNTCELSNRCVATVVNCQTNSNEMVPTTNTAAAHAAWIGLENLGNTCFMNTSLQCLLHIAPLVSFFRGAGGVHFEDVLNRSSPMKGSLAMSFHSLVQDIYSSPKDKAVSPINFMTAVSQWCMRVLLLFFLTVFVCA